MVFSMGYIVVKKLLNHAYKKKWTSPMWKSPLYLLQYLRYA